MDYPAGSETGKAMQEFTLYFRALVATLSEESGWYGVFARRDRRSIQDYLDGAHIPPWDVVVAALLDNAALRGLPVDRQESARAEQLHTAAVFEADAASGSHAALRARLETLLWERQHAVLREGDIARSNREGTHGPDEAARLANALAWARDDRERIDARCAEVLSRLQAVDPRRGFPDDWFRPPRTDGPCLDAFGPAQTAPGGPFSGAGEHPSAALGQPQEENAPTARVAAHPIAGAKPPHPGPIGGSAAADPVAASKQPTERQRIPLGARFAGAAYGNNSCPEPLRKPKTPPRGARFAGLAGTATSAPSTDSDSAQAPALPLRGARFAGAAVPEAPVNRTQEQATDPGALADRAAMRHTAARLGELRRAGSSGEAYTLMCEALAGPAEHVPALAIELEQAGLAAEVATLLWEVAAQSPFQLAASAVALVRAGRAGDCRTLLRQAAARRPADIACTAAALCDAGCDAEAVTLLAALAQTCSLEDVVEIVHECRDLVGLLLQAAGEVSVSRREEFAAALRRAGLPDRGTGVVR